MLKIDKRNYFPVSFFKKNTKQDKNIDERLNDPFVLKSAEISRELKLSSNLMFFRRF